LPAIGGKGVFTLEIENALLDGSIDFAVHSLKDLPPDLPEGLTLGCIPRRASASDVLILNNKHLHGGEVLEGILPTRGANIGTSSLRRRAMLLSLWPDVTVRDVRGNIDTRLRKLDDEGFDAIVLARAGLDRLGVEKRHSWHDLENYGFVPAPGQGALAIECRADDKRVLDLLRAVEDAATRAEITAERACMKALGAGCSTPLGANAVEMHDGLLQLTSVVLSPDGAERIEVKSQMPRESAAQLGEDVARELLQKGAHKLLATDH
jgi:hydroxymethylbilane synthase